MTTPVARVALACPVVTDLETRAGKIMMGLVHEMEDRYRRGEVGARSIQAFNRTVRNGAPLREDHEVNQVVRACAA